MIDFKAHYNKNPKAYFRAGYLLLGVLLLTGIGIYAFQKRESLLAEVIEKAKVKAQEEYNADLTIGKAAFSGLRSVLFNDIRLSPESGEQLIEIKRLELSIKLLPLFSGIIKMSRVDLSDTKLTLIKRDSISNYDFIFKKEESIADTLSKREPIDLGELAYRMINNVLYKIPDNMELRNLEMSYQEDTLLQQIFVPQADIDDGKLSSSIHINNNEAAWHLTGTLNPNKKKLYLKLFAEKGKVELPLLEQKYGLKLVFDTVETKLEKVKWKNKDELLMSGTWKVKNLLVNHWRIASNDVILPNGFLDTEINIGKNFIALDPTSEMKIAKLTAYPSAKITLWPHRTYAFGVYTEDMMAQDVFDSFPQGLFTSLEGIRVSGQMKYKLDFFLDTKLPDSVQLESALSATDFRVNAWGKADLPKINTSFVYTPYEDGKAQRSIVVGPGNPNYVPIGQVSPYLKNAILTAEDPSFFQHRGFVEEAIKASIATNFKEKAFKRGGSTISMQLVKNVYLNREKTLARKIEEMLIVWLIENNKVVSKERMFEVYLNIIEWGRNVYGVNEAAHYYFSKSPSDLSLGESIFLASIIPRPKSSLSRFDYNGHLKPYMNSYFNLIGGLMARRGYTQVDSAASYGFYSVDLREALRPKAPIVDSLEVENEGESLEDEIKGVSEMLRELFNKRLDQKNEQNPN